MPHLGRAQQPSRQCIILGTTPERIEKDSGSFETQKQCFFSDLVDSQQPMVIGEIR
jgi:hypothetical protein